MKQTKRILTIWLAVLLAMANAVPAAEARPRGNFSFGVNHRSSKYGQKNHGVNHQYVHDDHRRRDRHSHDYLDGNGGSYGIGGDCGFLHCHTAMPWG